MAQRSDQASAALPIISGNTTPPTAQAANTKPIHLGGSLQSRQIDSITGKAGPTNAPAITAAMTNMVGAGTAMIHAVHRAAPTRARRRIRRSVTRESLDWIDIRDRINPNQNAEGTHWATAVARVL